MLSVLLPLFFVLSFSKLNVHIISHTHDDVGWLKTVDQYYYGANNSIQNAGVQYILDTVIRELYEAPHRKFVYVEQAFFQRWWREQDDRVKAMTKVVVNRGQLEWANGGWCMHDEAAAHYIAMVDQTTLGHRELKKIFGDKGIPIVTWQIDPFGHSSTQASLLSARAGFEGLYFARIDYQDSRRRRADKDYEMIWRPSPSLGKNGQVFTGAFPSGTYCPPSGFNWDEFSGDAPMQDDPRLEDYNVKSRVDDFIKICDDLADVTKGNDIMLTMGCDFEYSNARTWFKNLDKLIKHVNADGRVNVFYSTPGQYTRAKLTSNVSWSVKTDDFFPYSDCPDCMWTGYFTSRSALKRYIRINSAYLNAVRQLNVFGGGKLGPDFEEAMGLAQHHDAVSGTSKQHVAYDYARHIAKGVAQADAVTSESLANLLKNSQNAPEAKFAHCHRINESYCEFTQQNNNFNAVIYNPTTKSRSELIRIPVTGRSYLVQNASGSVIPSQVEQTFSPFPKQVKPSPFTLYFIANTNGMETVTYFIKRQSEEDIKVEKKANNKAGAASTIENNAVSVSYDTVTGKISQILNKVTSVALNVTQEILYYNSYQQPFNQQSGAYIFRPASTSTYPVCKGRTAVAVVTGPVVSEIRTTCDGWIAQTVRIIQNQEFVEVEYQVGAVPIQDGQGKEVISRFSTSVQSGNTWYTDSNGREYQTRVLNFRPTWNLTVYQPVAGNYYPVNVGIYVKDSQNQFSLLTDRSVGGSSLSSGQVEVMIQRRLLYDDSRGVGEPLNETDAITPYDNDGNGGVRIGTGIHITSTQRLLVDSSVDGYSLRKIRTEQNNFFSQLVVVFGSISEPKTWSKGYSASARPLKNNLPVNVEIMTLQALESGEYLIRLAHQFAVGEDTKFSKPAVVNFQDLFTFKMNDIKEVSLTTNRDIKGFSHHTTYKGDEEGDNQETMKIIPLSADQVTINPMDIRTFIFKKG